jgi:hypothetical protein
MSQQITEAFVKQFRDGITLRAQQMESRLRGAVRTETVSGTSASFDFIGSRTPAKRQSRHADTVLSDTPHDRRWVEMSVYDDADLIDKPDLVRTLTDPTNTYTKSMAAGFGRKIDQVIIAGATGTTKTGVDGAGTSTAPTQDKIEPNLDGTAAGIIGLGSMRVMKKLFDQAEQSPNRHWAMDAVAFDGLLQDDGKLTNADYNSVKVLVQGEVNSFMGFEWHRVESPILSGDGVDNFTVAWVPEAIVLAFGADVQASIDRRPDKNNSMQIFYSADFGAARLDDNGVISMRTLAAGSDTL